MVLVHCCACCNLLVKTINKQHFICKKKIKWPLDPFYEFQSTDKDGIYKVPYKHCGVS